MIRTVLFDLDGTLLDRDASVQSFVADQHQRWAASLGHIPRQDYIDRWVEYDCRGHVWKDNVYQSLVSEFSITESTWEQLLEDYETGFASHCIPFAGLVEMLSQLKHDYMLGIITNGLGSFQSRVVNGLGIDGFFDAILISEVEQLRKPQPEIFQRALQRLNGSSRETVFVGDHPDADIGGARGAGLKAIWKRNPYFPEPVGADGVIDELEELPPLLQSL